MTVHYPITVIEQPTEHDYNVIFNGINGFARAQGLNVAAGSYFFAIYDESQMMKAAISGFDNFGCCEIGGLWVDESLRGKGYGRALVEKAEEWARTHGCKALTVFTLKEWPAFSWYKSLGFTVEFERVGHTSGMTGCYLIKKFQGDYANA